MNFLSVYTSHDGAVTIVKDNKLLVHSQADRFNRFKGSPRLSFNLFDKISKLNIKFDKVFVSELRGNDSDSWIQDIVLLNIAKFKDIEKITEHHLFHKFCAMATTGANKHFAVMDGGGLETQHGTETLSLYKNNKVINRHYFNVNTQQGIGGCYEWMTGVLLNKENFILPYRHTGKLMAYSTYGETIESLIEKFIKDIALNNIYGKFPFKLSTNKNDTLSQNYIHNFQKAVEIMVINAIGYDDLTFTGGVAQNVLINSKMLNYKNFKVDPLCNDQGISLGVANYVLNGSLHVPNVYLGFEPIYNLNIFNDKYSITEADLNNVCDIVNTEPMAIYQGRSEQGQRGLGNRSLLINPYTKDALEKINKIKKREWYRPFSPIILEEDASDYFEMTIPKSPYMLFVFKSKKDIPLVIAKDGTSRIQTVGKDNINLYRLLKKFKIKHKLPLLLNTSLNLSGHVLVETMEDLKYMMDNTSLRYAYLPDINKLIIKHL